MATTAVTARNRPGLRAGRGSAVGCVREPDRRGCDARRGLAERPGGARPSGSSGRQRSLDRDLPGRRTQGVGLPYQSYKGPQKRKSLEVLADALCETVPLLDLVVAADQIRQVDDVFDAVVCALVARAAALGQVTGPPTGNEERARREG